MTSLKDYVTIGYSVVVHAVHIEKGYLVGIEPVVLDKVRVKEGSVIGAGFIVSESTPALSSVMGFPARRAQGVPDKEVQISISHALQYEEPALVQAAKGINLEFTETQK